MDIVDLVEKEVIDASEKYKNEVDDHYDYWNEHIKYVYYEAINLAKKYNANLEIVKLGALLHDIALIKRVGERNDHHENGKILADKILDKYNYPNKEKVLGCILHHRSSKNATNIEELCVADADVLAHFDNIPMLFNSAFNRNKLSLDEVKTWMKDVFEKDYDDLSDNTKKEFKERYNLIKEIVLGKEVK